MLHREDAQVAEAGLPQQVDASEALHVFLAEPEGESAPVQGYQLNDAGDDLPGVGVPARIGKAVCRKEPDVGVAKNLLAGHALEEVLGWVDEPKPGMVREEPGPHPLRILVAVRSEVPEPDHATVVTLGVVREHR